MAGDQLIAPGPSTIAWQLSTGRAVGAVTLPLLLRLTVPSQPVPAAAAAAVAGPPAGADTARHADPYPDGTTVPATGWARTSEYASPVRMRPMTHGSPTGGVSRRVLRPYSVAAGDCAWDIAESELGDPRRWREIWALNAGRPQADGRSWTEPDIIRPGWRLLLPAPPEPATHPPQRRPTSPGGPPRTEPPRPSPTILPEPDGQPGPPPNGGPARTASPAASVGGGQPTASTPATESPPLSDPAGGVRLPSGTIAAAALASAVGTAVAVTRLRRRHHRTIGSLGALGGTDVEPPLPAPVAALRRAHLQHITEAPGAGETGPERPDRTAAAVDGRAPPGWPPPSPAVTGEGPGGPVAVDLITTGGLGLDGPGAADAARAALAAVLAPDVLHPARAVMPAADAAALLPGTDPAEQPALIVTDTLAAALRRLEAELIHRARLADDTSPEHVGPDDGAIDGLRAAEPAESLPTLMLVASPEPDLAARTGAVLELGRHRGLVGVLLGAWQDGAEVAADGAVTAARGVAAVLAGAHLHTSPLQTPPLSSPP